MTIGIRELARNTKIIEQYDYVEIEDKKTHEKKGLLISPKYADEFKALLEKKISAEKKAKLDKIMQFAGILNGETQNMTSQEIKASKRAKYYND
ncbi:MAG TPA: hypothetical protein PLH07_05900 [Sulfurovum sp.]|jgi:hypothetical protein|nr:MAG: hypothetical protein B7Y63_03850 [Sulfurovum sp. 35-42-20]OYY57012.1 MAG: hypothetical protein B7Y52_02280 [Sulfurovum sp. 28-43-6]OYZ25514.1 MAG: hypothetical protein B7Y23_05010 [Sulfurovum sp. 16-42-52]OYZ48221.1 MAG: hypothetical protein B7Y13_08320 [Sulfurovum sp. 24-42-9]OZA45633.1 MAG: hypothetical protein B7X80_04455 [Sulfurovum sp. 17-42-90]OZA59369.1 MAG: hypothetical protein B7X69_08255 [Sulfurovum sp. 39-42-12]HQR74022.1 hypothetical protein [Sulfurovum sp.]